jgi:predicted acylesterase/phospholipase RssA
MNLGRRVAVILAGAVAKGAFEAGALKVLAEKLAASDGRIVRIVAASSGALNGTLLAAGAHGGDLPKAAADLATLWITEGGLGHALNLNWRDMFALRGVSDQRNLLRLLSSRLRPRSSGEEIELRIIVASLGGVVGKIGGDDATTYEAVLRFTKSHFETQQGLDEIFRAASASSSFPAVFAPFDPGRSVGPCIDGGAVNNTPVKHALENSAVDSVVVIGATVENAPPGSFDGLSGASLAGHAVDVLINERLYGDLREAESVNTSLQRLHELDLPPETLERVKAAIGWSLRRPVSIVRVRPLAPLPGNSFSGFVSASLRERYVALGEQRAREVL